MLTLGYIALATKQECIIRSTINREDDPHYDKQCNKSRKPSAGYFLATLYKPYNFLRRMICMMVSILNASLNKLELDDGFCIAVVTLSIKYGFSSGLITP